MPSDTAQPLGHIWECCPRPRVPAGSPPVAALSPRPPPPYGQGLLCPRHPTGSCAENSGVNENETHSRPCCHYWMEPVLGLFFCLSVFLLFCFSWKEQSPNKPKAITYCFFFLTFPLLQPCHLKPSKQNSMRQTPASQLLMPTATA